MPPTEPEDPQPPRTDVVTGITGAVGHVVAQELTQRGHHVRGLSRHAGIPIDDPAALAAAFHGAAEAFLMIPSGVGGTRDSQLHRVFAAQRPEGWRHCAKAKRAAAAMRSSEIMTTARVVYWCRIWCSL